MLELLAKSNPKETIREHTDLLLKDAKIFFDLYGEHFTEKEKELIMIACKIHDYGKAIFPFQQKINSTNFMSGKDKTQQVEIKKFYKSIKDSEKIPHGYISPAFLSVKKLKENFDEVQVKILLNSIYNHHNRDYLIDSQTIKNIIDNDLKKRYPEIEIKSGYLNYIVKNLLNDDLWVSYAVILGILNRFDYHASSHSDEPIEISPLQDGKSIANIVTNQINCKYGQVREVQSFMSYNNDSNLVVVASTGIGKTEASLMWVGSDKAFYTLPLKVSINSIYQRIKNEYKYSTDKVTLLHSDAITYLLEENEDDFFQKYNTTRFLSYPLTICTIDQLFTFVYKYKGSEKLLATLKYSKVIIDEIQSYLPALVAKIIYGLKLITQIGGKFAIVTATMPPVFEYFLKQNEIKFIKPENPFLSKENARHFITYVKTEFDYDYILQQAQTKKVLVICNTVKKAQEVFDKLKNCNDTHLLHSHFIKSDRAKLEKMIMQFTANGNNDSGIWISTQIVEASLDIDFDILFTEMCTADSLLQRLGRCYRKREYIENKPNVYICDTGNGYGTVYEYKDIYDRSVNYLCRYNNTIFTEEQKIDYVNSVYSVEDLKQSKYFEDIAKEIQSCKNAVPGIYSKEDALNSFRNISNIEVIPESIYCELNKDSHIDDLIKIINFYTSDKISKIKAREELYGYTISIGKFSKKAKLTDFHSIDKSNSIKIYRISAEYDFDNNKNTGKGLLDNTYIDNFL